MQMGVDKYRNAIVYTKSSKLLFKLMLYNPDKCNVSNPANKLSMRKHAYLSRAVITYIGHLYKLLSEIAGIVI